MAVCYSNSIVLTGLSEELSSMLSVIHFRMELHSIKAPPPVLHAGYRAVIRMSRDHKAFRRAADYTALRNLQ